MLCCAVLRLDGVDIIFSFFYFILFYLDCIVCTPSNHWVSHSYCTLFLSSPSLSSYYKLFSSIYLFILFIYLSVILSIHIFILFLLFSYTVFTHFFFCFFFSGFSRGWFKNNTCWPFRNGNRKYPWTGRSYGKVQITVKILSLKTEIRTAV